MDIMVLNVGDVPYAAYSLDILHNYCRKHRHTLHVITENPTTAHPSWLKMLCHDFIKSEFIMCWDLDLLPTANAEPIEPHLDRSLFNMCWDTPILLGERKAHTYSRYNCGLIGIPRAEADFCKAILTDNDHNNGHPYEQNHFNRALSERGYPVKELPSRFNSLHPPNGYNRTNFRNACGKHYTVWTAHERMVVIKQHYAAYFGDSDYPG